MAVRQPKYCEPPTPGGLEAIEKVEDQAVLARVAREDRVDLNRHAAGSRVKDPVLLASLASDHSVDREVRREAILNVEYRDAPTKTERPRPGAI